MKLNVSFWPFFGDHAEILTLRCVAACSILHEDIVKRLVSAIGQLVDPHGSDPLLAHGAFGVPAVDHTVITRPGEEGGTRSSNTGQMSEKKTIMKPHPSVTCLLCFIIRPTEYWTSRCSAALCFFTSGVTGCFLCWMCSSVCCTK